MDRSTLAVGAYSANVGAAAAGKVFLFERNLRASSYQDSANLWMDAKVLSSSAPAASAQYGKSMMILVERGKEGKEGKEV